MRKLLTYTFLVSSALCLLACGGGGGGSSTPPASGGGGTTPMYTLSATIAGVAPLTVTVANGTDTATGSTSALIGNYPAATAYNVTVTAAPSGQVCTVTGGSGTISADKSVAVNCVPGVVAVKWTATEASASATSKSLRGNSVFKAFVVNVTDATATATLTVTGNALNGGGKAVQEYWITTTDDADINGSCSTKGVTRGAFTNGIANLIFGSTGTKVICAKMAGNLQSNYVNASAVGLSLTSGTTTVSTASYTANSVSTDVAGCVKVEHQLSHNAVRSAGRESPNGGFGGYVVRPTSDSACTVYDGNKYPSRRS